VAATEAGQTADADAADVTGDATAAPGSQEAADGTEADATGVTESIGTTQTATAIPGNEAAPAVDAAVNADADSANA
jgi:hypothetical protein